MKQHFSGKNQSKYGIKPGSEIHHKLVGPGESVCFHSGRMGPGLRNKIKRQLKNGPTAGIFCIQCSFTGIYKLIIVWREFVGFINLVEVNIIMQHQALIFKKKREIDIGTKNVPAQNFRNGAVKYKA